MGFPTDEPAGTCTSTRTHGEPYRYLMCQIVNQGAQFYTRQWVCHVTMPSGPLDDNFLMCVAEQLLVFVSDRQGLVTMEAIGDGGGRDAKFFPGSAKGQVASAHSRDRSLNESFVVIGGGSVVGSE